MKRNPIYQKDELLSNRSPILPVLMLSTNAVLAFLVLINIYSVSGNAATPPFWSFIIFSFCSSFF